MEPSPGPSQTASSQSRWWRCWPERSVSPLPKLTRSSCTRILECLGPVLGCGPAGASSWLILQNLLDGKRDIVDVPLVLQQLPEPPGSSSSVLELFPMCARTGGLGGKVTRRSVSPPGGNLTLTLANGDYENVAVFAALTSSLTV